MKTASRYMKKPHFIGQEATLGVTSINRMPNETHPVRLTFQLDDCRLPIALTFDETVTLAKFLNRAVETLNGTPGI